MHMDAPSTDTLGDIYRWSTGNGVYMYHTLLQCLGGDMITATAIIGLCFTITLGYGVIAYRWFTASKNVPPSRAKKAFSTMMWIFVLCACCGYLWNVIRMFYPVWRLYVLLLIMLNIATWRFVLTGAWMADIAEHFMDRQRLISAKEDALVEIAKLRCLLETKPTSEKEALCRLQTAGNITGFSSSKH